MPGLIALVILLFMNLATVKLFGEMEFWFALIKVIAILGLIVIGIFMIIKGFSTNAGAVRFRESMEPRWNVPKWNEWLYPLLPDGCVCLCWN